MITSFHSAQPSKIVDYFYKANIVMQGPKLPPRTQRCSDTVVFHLMCDPSYKRIKIQEAADLYSIPDLLPVLSEYNFHLNLKFRNKEIHIDMIGRQRHTGQTSPLPFKQLECWNKVCLQTKAYFYPHDNLTPVTINASPPKGLWAHGHCNSAIYNMDLSEKWPKSGLKGEYFIELLQMVSKKILEHVVVDLCIIF